MMGRSAPGRREGVVFRADAAYIKNIVFNCAKICELRYHDNGYSLLVMES